MKVDKGRKGIAMPEKQPPVMINFLVRAILGFALIFFINKFLDSNDIALSVGLNPVTFVTSGVLGTPGVALLYGITFYRGL